MKNIPENIIMRAKCIKLVIFDVDGVLSDGKLYYSDNDVECKAFHVHDGAGIVALLQMGIEVAIITKRTSPLLTKRMQHLGVKHVYQGQEDKRIAYADLLKILNLTHDEVAYMGDDIVDLPVLRQVGLSITVANAVPYIAEYTHWQTTLPGGEGAAREACDLILSAQGLLPVLLKQYLT
ncbi:MAG: kdsC [Gammaproteobacteria bacterium]|nr:kdsC [Gammaproteobacteria bacterium]